jgi:radical SAM superfamily enzyme YgiQ (UPF0313 family)
VLDGSTSNLEFSLERIVNDLRDNRSASSSGDTLPLSATPRPDFHLANMKRYSAMSVHYSRGCPLNCEFCDIIEIYGRVPRTKSNQQMLAEIDALRDLGWRSTVRSSSYNQ